MSKKYIYFIIYLTYCLFNYSYSYSQNQPKQVKVEIEARQGSDNYNIFPIGKNGLILFYQSKINKKLSWIFSRYDTVFNENWSKEVVLPANFYFNTKYYDSKSNILYILLLQRTIYNLSYNYSYQGAAMIMRIDLSDGSAKMIKTFFPKKITIEDFKVISDIAFISGTQFPSNGTLYLQSFFCFTLIPAFTGLSLFHFQPFLLKVNLNNSKSFEINSSLKGNAYLLSSQINDNNNFTCFIKHLQSNKLSEIIINNYSSDTVSSYSFKSTTDTAITFIKQIKLNEKDALIGTFKKFHRKSIVFNPLFYATSEYSLSSEGLFFCLMNNNKPEFIKYHSFSLFDKTNDLTNAKKSKSERRKKKYSVNYQLIIHNILQKNNEYIIVAEAYIPEYHSEYFWTTDIYGRTYQESHEIFDGFRYIKAIIASFDNSGNLLWTNTFDIGNIVTFNLKERVRVFFDNDNIVMAYCTDGKITSTTIRKNLTIQPKEDEVIDETIKSKNSENSDKDFSSDMDFWYDNYFIVYGYKKLSDKIQTKESKTIFYFNKLSFK